MTGAMPRRKPPRRDKQEGRAIVSRLGDHGDILFPDGGAAPLRVFLRRLHDRPSDGHGSHRDGRHKKG